MFKTYHGNSEEVVHNLTAVIDIQDESSLVDYLKTILAFAKSNKHDVALMNVILQHTGLNLNVWLILVYNSWVLNNNHIILMNYSKKL